jgi:hypothetical protein
VLKVTGIEDSLTSVKTVNGSRFLPMMFEHLSDGNAFIEEKVRKTHAIGQ